MKSVYVEYCLKIFMSNNNENSNKEYDLPLTTGIRITFVIVDRNSIKVAVDINGNVC